MRTPLLALLALRRPRNLAPIVLAYAGLGLVAVVVGAPVVAILALSPSPLIGPAIARFVGARAETVGALLTGTVVLSFPLLIGAIPGIASNVNVALFAFVLGTALGAVRPCATCPFLVTARVRRAAISSAAPRSPRYRSSRASGGRRGRSCSGVGSSGRRDSLRREGSPRRRRGDADPAVAAGSRSHSVRGGGGRDAPTPRWSR